MNRNDELKQLRQDLEQTPVELDYTLTRATARLEQSKQRKRWLLTPVVSLASLLLAFVILVNTSVSFALSVKHVPLLSDLAAAVAFSPSLSEAIKHDYVQFINQEKSLDDVTARVEYVIVDEHQLNVFYQLDAKSNPVDAVHKLLDLNGQPQDGYSSVWSNGFEKDDDIRKITFDFHDLPVPNQFRLQMTIIARPDMELLTAEPSSDPVLGDELGVLAFDLTIDPTLIREAQVITLNHLLEQAGAKALITKAEIYPTHFRLYVEPVEGSPSRLTDIDFYLVNQSGERFEAIRSGVSNDGRSWRVESPYFSDNKHLKLVIIGLTWLDHDQPRTMISLANQTATDLPEGVSFVQAEQQGNDWTLAFQTFKVFGLTPMSPFGWTYTTPEGETYDIESMSSMGDEGNDPSLASDYFELKDVPGTTVFLTPLYSRFHLLDEPIEIQIK